MADGYTQSFLLIRYACNNSKSIVIEIDREEFQLVGQNDIKKISCSNGTFTFYNDYEEVLDYYGTTDVDKFEGKNVYLETVLFNDTDISDGDIYDVPAWGGEIKVYYIGDIEAGEDPAPGITITLSPSNLTLSVGETGVIEASTYSDQSIIWETNDTAIATVIGSGKSATVTAVSVGTTTITAFIGSVSASCNITVSVPSNYTLKIYDETKADIMKTITIPNGDKINRYIYETGVYKEINIKDGYYISEWRNNDNDNMIPDDQVMGGNLDIYPIYTELPTASYYSKVYLPNLTQRFPFGAVNNYSLGDTGGEETHKLTISEMPLHNHNLSYVDSNGGSEKNYYAYGQHLDPSVKMGRIDTAVSDDQYMTGVSGVKNQSGTFMGNIVTSTGGGDFHNNMPPYLVVNFIIKYQ